MLSSLCSDYLAERKESRVNSIMSTPRSNKSINRFSKVMKEGETKVKENNPFKRFDNVMAIPEEKEEGEKVKKGGLVFGKKEEKGKEVAAKENTTINKNPKKRKRDDSYSAKKDGKLDLFFT